jgi:flagellar biosynthetic protein FlhB
MTPGDGGEKTEKATPKKRQDARKKGQVLKSAEVSTAVMTITMFLAVMLFGSMILTGMLQSLRVYLGPEMLGSKEEMSPRRISAVFGGAVWELFVGVAPLLAVAFLAGIAVNLVQVGFLFVPSALAPKFSKINPIEGFKRIFSLRSVVELLKAVLKAVVVGVIVYQEFQARMVEFPDMMYIAGAGEPSSVYNSGRIIFDIVIGVALRASMALIAVGLADYVYQWFDFEKNLKMSKEEIKQEYKTTEGDPLIKSKRREKQRQISMSRMMQALPKADVVITNPTHYAVALQYDADQSEAPVVLCKGKDFLARKIKQKAAELRIELVENRPVAQALYAGCEIGEMIPGELFAAVAEILAYVYRKKKL